MPMQQYFLMGLLVVVLIFFIWGRWRYDVVAFFALVVATLAGTVDPVAAFSGFGHPATVTVAMVLIIGRGLQNSGAVNLIARHLLPSLKSTEAHIGVLSSVAGALSAIMNNVGALALLMPAALQSAARAKQPAAVILMPLSFGSILGGLVTLIGTPPNIIIATFRGDVGGAPFTMFDFAPVGGAVAVVGIIFVAAFGWRLIPKHPGKQSSAIERFDIKNYVMEVRPEKDSLSIGKTIAEIDEIAREHDATVLTLIRRGKRLRSRRTEIKAADHLIIEIGPDRISGLNDALQLRPAGQVKSPPTRFLEAADTSLTEILIAPGSRLIGQTGEHLRLQRRFSINLLGVSRQGRPFPGRLKSFRFRLGDVLLLEGDPEYISEAIVALGCLPLAERGLHPVQPQLAGISILVFAGAVVGASLGLLPLTIALALAAGLMVLLNIVPPRDIYDSIDWPVIVLLGSMIPIGQAMGTTGTTHLITAALLALAGDFPPVLALTLLLVLTMTLSDVMNNAATAVVMAPISIDMATQLGVNSDPFLMAVAIGASCAFLTPIGHQNNALIMGPGGYRFGDFWQLGLPLEVLIVFVSIPMLMWIWPF